jgi:ankyrin repeat protein
MNYYKEILSLIDKEKEIDIFEKARKWNILFDSIDENGNNLIHLSAKKNMLTLTDLLLKEDKSNATVFQGQEFNRIINKQNENDKTPLDLGQTKEMTDLIRDYGGKTGSEIEKEFETMEDVYYSAMDDVSKIQTAHITSSNMFDAIKNNDNIEFKRLYELDSTEGGLVLHRLIAKNKSGRTFLEYAEKLEHEEIIRYLKIKTSQNNV